MSFPDDTKATAAHEFAHYLAAKAFKKFAAPIVADFKDESSDHTASGVCFTRGHFTRYQASVFGWAGILGELMVTRKPFGMMPRFVPNSRNLRDWFSAMMATGLQELSRSDSQLIVGFKNPWLSCKRAYAILRANISKLKSGSGLIDPSPAKAEIFSGPVPGVVYFSLADRIIKLKQYIATNPPDKEEMRQILHDLKKQLAAKKR